MIEVKPRLDEPAVAHEGRRMIVTGCASREEHFRMMRFELFGVKEAVELYPSGDHILNSAGGVGSIVST